LKHHENMDSFTASTSVPVDDITPKQYTDLRIPPITDAKSFFARIKYYYDTYPVKTMIITLCRIVISFIAAMLAWNCNEFSGSILRILITFIAFIFAEVYILYYAIYHTIAGIACYTGFSDLEYDNTNSDTYDSSY
jgi:hypothetical protein